MDGDTNDRSVDAEWIIKKNDWRQQRQQKSMREERTAASLWTSQAGSCGSPAESYCSPSLGDHGLGGNGMDFVTTNAYLPKVDEIRCLL